ncbi:division/cell wall cluster transcriptional repressor MraZ [Cribrihabitans marinus]|uniref:division/cell wall cluster transcriptional repressor MraZ n=1 Tax=Cribrihabitans marinus TaxID=1227549 RepID=UPI000AF2A002|nr:division/cell wall cluster transcriptional repressor MraZ [Cribrihabitans marinus]
MARRFRGESHHKVDAKGRVSIPASFRRVLEAGDPNWHSGGNPDLVIVYGDHRRKYLECYTMEAIDEVDAKIDALPRGSMQRKMLQRLFHGQSFPTNVDETGRLVLPAKLRGKIGLEGEAFFIAAGDTFQIWKPETYEAEELAATEEWLDELPEDFDPLQFLDGPASDGQGGG